MTTVGQIERATQNRVVKLFQSELGYDYLGDWSDRVEAPKDTAAYLRFFCAADTADKDQLKLNEAKRITLYKLTVSLIRAYADLASEMTEAGYTPAQTDKIKQEVDHYEKVRSEVKMASGDYIDLKMYEPAMRHLIDTYITAYESEKISAFDDLNLVQLLVERGVDGCPVAGE